MFLGFGGNGKSKLIELYEYACGSYCAKLPIASLTGKRASGSAPQPEIARLVGKRMVVMQEPNEGETFQVGALKELSGGDTITVRTLHKEPFDFNPQFTIFCTCNQLPKVPADDGGTWRRIRVVKSTEIENPDPTVPMNFQLITTYKRNSRNGQNLFLVTYTTLSDFPRKRKSEPEEVLCATNEYQEITIILAIS